MYQNNSFPRISVEVEVKGRVDGKTVWRMVKLSGVGDCSAEFNHTPIYSVGDEVSGVGFLVSDRYVLTCAHVVQASIASRGELSSGAETYAKVLIAQI